MSKVKELLKGLDPEQRRRFLRSLGEKSGKVSASSDRIVPGRRGDGPIPLSFGQQRLWFMAQLHPESPRYNMGTAIEFRGPLKAAALEAAFNEVIRRHEILRTTFSFDEEKQVPVQVIGQGWRLELPVVDLRALPPAAGDVEVRRWIRRVAHRPFVLARGPLLRALLLRLSHRRHALALVMHHIVSDGWSFGVFVREVSALYQACADGRPSPLPELPVQYGDFALWQQSWLESPDYERQLAYWRGQLAGAPATLKLPFDHPRTDSLGFRGADHPFTLPAETVRALRELNRGEQATPFMSLFTVFSILLFRWTGQEDLAVGTDIAHRNRSEVEGLIGFFVNNLVLRADLSGNPSFRELLARSRETTLGAYAHQDLPFDLLVRELRPERKLSEMPLFQVLFVLQNTPPAGAELPGLQLRAMDLELDAVKFDLALFLNESDREVEGILRYRVDLFKPATVERMCRDFESILQAVTRQPDDRIQHLLGAMTDMQSTSRHESKVRSLRGARGRARRRVEEPVATGHPVAGRNLPFMYRAQARDLDPAGWAHSRRREIEDKVTEYGAVLFRDFSIRSVADFENFARSVCPDLYGDYGDLPREEEGKKVYQATPYPADKAILFHNESSHTHRWPMRQFFYSAEVAPEGGETPIVDCREICRQLDPSVLEVFEKKQLMYVRNFVEHLDVSWREFFRIDSKEELERLCRESDIEFEWREDGLRTRQIAPAVLRHPKTGERIFFNQIQLHHVACLEPDVRESMTSMFGEERMPRNVFYGDGTPIEDSLVEEITQLYWECSAAFPWQQGDVLLVDNMLCAHARNPYSGARKIVVAMGDVVQGREVM